MQVKWQHSKQLKQGKREREKLGLVGRADTLPGISDGMEVAGKELCQSDHTVLGKIAASNCHLAIIYQVLCVRTAPFFTSLVKDLG